jgi:signal recognition particle subunit SRP54
VIVDTAGRLHIDEELMEQAAAIRAAVEPDETLFVIDAMIGQEAVNVAKAFLDGVGFDGVILSKLDGDARGGAALSVREVTGRPIKFASIGEKLEDFEAFHPDRMAGRILGMGDVMTLIEKAEATYSEEEAAQAEQALMSGQFTLEDFLQQMQMLKRMGPLQGLLGMMPGMGKQLKDVDVDDKQVARVEAIIRSMTPKERRDPKILNGRRRKRIAAGSGTTVTEVNRLVKQFAEVQKVMKSAAKMAGMQGMKPKGVKGAKAQAAALRQLQSGGGLPGGPGGLGGFSGLQAPPPKRGKR